MQNASAAETSIESEIPMNHKTDMQAALQACVDAMLHDGVPTDPYHPRRVALNAAEAALASRPDAQTDERYDLLQAAVNCPHEIESNRVVLHYSDKQPGHNALAQLRERLARTAAPQAEAAQGVAAPSLYFYGDHEHGFECPDDAAIISGRKVGDRYTLNAAWYAEVQFEVTKVPDETSDDYEVREVIAAPSSDREQVGDVPEGCTPADAEMLRKANHALAAENDRLRHCLRPFAQLANSRLSWAMVEYCVKDDPEKQTLQALQMQRAFNRAAEALSDDASPSRECGERQGAAAVVREALEAAFEERDGWRVKVAAAVRTIGAASAPTLGEPKLAVWYGPMPESNGKTNWTAILHKGDIASGMTIDRSEYPDRVRYEADRVRWLIDELADEPFIPDYDADKNSGYVAQQPKAAEPKGITDEQREIIRQAANCLEFAITLTQDGYDGEPGPASEWDHGALRLVVELRALLAEGE